MNKTPRLGKSGIEYLDCVWNFYSGCHHKQMGICSVGNCWAEDIVNRFGGHYPNGFEPTYYPEAFLSPLYLKKPSIIGCAFMGDLFGDWVNPEEKFHSVMPSRKASISMSLKGWIFTTIKQCPQHTFLFKTKNPQNLIKWSPFPDNCWVGVTVCNQDMLNRAMPYLLQIEASVRFASLEPLLGKVDVAKYLPHPNWNLSSWYEDDKGIERWDLGGAPCSPLNWLIIGAQTKPTVYPKIEWVQEIVEAADRAGIPVFLKDNLWQILPWGHPFIGAKYYYRKFRQEMPNEEA